MQIHIDESEQPTAKDEGKQMQDREIAQNIEKFIEVKNMDLEHELHREYSDLVPKAPQVIPWSPQSLVVKPALRKKGDVVLLDDNRVMDVYNISFAEF